MVCISSCTIFLLVFFRGGGGGGLGAEQENDMGNVEIHVFILKVFCLKIFRILKAQNPLSLSVLYKKKKLII